MDILTGMLDRYKNIGYHAGIRQSGEGVRH